MSDFNPGDKVIKRTEKDAANWGKVMDLPDTQQKPGYVAVMFQRHVWIMPQNLMHFDEWKKQRRTATKPQKSVRDFWTKEPIVLLTLPLTQRCGMVAT